VPRRACACACACGVCVCVSYYNFSYNNLSSSFCDLYRVVVFSARENAYGLLPSKENVFIIS